MRLILLVTLTMIAFAANSVLNRAALSASLIDPFSFAAIRLLAGISVLLIVVGLRRDLRRLRGAFDAKATAGLLAYMLGFSFAYITLDAGLGALILFGGVQITMFAGAVLQRQNPHPLQWIGAAVAFGGLVLLLAPSEAPIAPQGFALMALAAFGWGVYSLQGAKAHNPLLATAANFVAAGLLLTFPWLALGIQHAETKGIILAVLSGGLSSALGYALWYSVLPKLHPASASVAQLSVPIIATLGGVFLLSEPLTLPFVIATALVLIGIAISILGRR